MIFEEAATADELDRFWSKVDRHGPTVRSDLGPCQLWTGAKNNDGYGRFYFRGELVRAHAFGLWLRTGKWAPYIMHPCDTPACVVHGQASTHLMNIRDCVEKKRHVKPQRCPVRSRQPGENNGKARFTVKDVREIRSLYKNGVTQVEIARRYKTRQSHISSIVLGKLWPCGSKDLTKRKSK